MYMYISVKLANWIEWIKIDTFLKDSIVFYALIGVNGTINSCRVLETCWISFQEVLCITYYCLLFLCCHIVVIADKWNRLTLSVQVFPCLSWDRRHTLQSFPYEFYMKNTFWYVNDNFRYLCTTFFKENQIHSVDKSDLVNVLKNDCHLVTETHWHTGFWAI